MADQSWQKYKDVLTHQSFGKEYNEAENNLQRVECYRIYSQDSIIAASVWRQS